MHRRKEGTSCCLGRVKSVNIRLFSICKRTSTCPPVVLRLEERQLMRMSRGGCTAAHLLLPTTFSLQTLRADKERTVGKNYPPPAQNKDELAAGCVQCWEAGRHSRGEERASVRAPLARRAKTNGNAVRLGGRVRVVQFTVVYTHQGIHRSRELPWFKGKVRFCVPVLNNWLHHYLWG